MPSEHGDTILEFRDVGLRMGHSQAIYGRRAELLHNISFSVRSGEVMGVIGRNGAGKSLLCRVAIGALLPTSGEVIFSGRRRFLLSLGQYVNKLMRLEEQLRSLCAWQGVTGQNANELVASALAYGEVEGLAGHSMGTLSSGQQARALFSLAMTLDIDLLTIDETLSVGDIDFRKKSHDKILEHMRRGKSTMLVTHNTNTLRSLCDAAVYIDRGAIVEMGSVDRVVERYQVDLAHDMQGARGGEGQALTKRLSDFSNDEAINVLVDLENFGEFFVRRKYEIDNVTLEMMRLRFSGDFIGEVSRYRNCMKNYGR